MTIKNIIEQNIFDTELTGNNLDKEIMKPFCCDLLSIAMGKAAEDHAWVTVMGNLNTIAVAALAEVSCIILAEGVKLDAAARTKAVSEGITVLYSEDSIFDAALRIHNLLES